MSIHVLGMKAYTPNYFSPFRQSLNLSTFSRVSLKTEAFMIFIVKFIILVLTNNARLIIIV